MGTLVGTPQSLYQAASSTTIAQSYGTAVAVGDVALVAVSGYHATATVSSLASSVAATITRIGTLLRGSVETPPPFMDVYSVVFTAAGTPTFTGTYSSAQIDRGLRSIVWRGIDTTTPLEATNGGTGSDGTAESGSVTTANPGPIVSFLREWQWAANHNHNTGGSPNTGWTEWGDDATGGDSKYRNETGTGTYNGDFSWTAAPGNDEWVCRIVALRDAAAGRTINAATATLTLTGQQAAISRGRTVNAATAALTLTPQAATVSRGRTVNVATATLTLSALAASVSLGRTVNANTAALTLTAYPATITAGGGRTVAATTAEISVTTYPATIVTGRTVLCSCASLFVETFRATVVLGEAPQAAPVFAGYYLEPVRKREREELAPITEREQKEEDATRVVPRVVERYEEVTRAPRVTREERAEVKKAMRSALAAVLRSITR